MKNTSLLLSLLCSLPLLQGCESVPPKQAWGFQPLLRLEHAKQSPAAYYQLGRYYQGQNRPDLAIPAFQYALVLDRHYAEAHNALGSLYAGQRQFELAIMEFRLALAIAPDTPHFYNNLGYAYYLQGRHSEAATALEKAAMLKPGDTRINTNLDLARTQKTAAEPPQQAMAAAAPASDTVTVAAARTPPAEVGAPPALQAIATAPQAPVIASPQMVPPLAPQQAAETATLAATAVDTPPLIPPPRYEVANGNGVTGMARRVSQVLLARGYPAARLSNSKPFRQAMTVIEYRPGYAGAAARLSASLPLQPVITENSSLRQHTDVRLLLGRDVIPRLALLTPQQSATRLAHGG